MRVTKIVLTCSMLALVLLASAALVGSMAHTSAPGTQTGHSTTPSSSSASYPFAGAKPTAQQQVAMESGLHSTQQRLLYDKFLGFYHAH